jgi:hypothetical protein
VRNAVRVSSTAAERDARKTWSSPRSIVRRSPCSVAVGLDRDLHRAAGAQLQHGPGVGVGAQEVHGPRVVHAGAREEAAEAVAALDALLAPVHRRVLAAVPRGQRQGTLDEAGGHDVERRVLRDAERRDGAQAEAGKQQALAEGGHRAHARSAIAPGRHVRLR